MAHETTYILLLRGINVGGRNKLPTAPFCEQLKSEGFSNVRSYLASGNLLLDSAEPVDVIQEKIRALIRRQDPTVVFRRIREMPLREEIVSFGERVVFWGKFAEETYSRTAYHRLLLKESFYPHITIRNGRTFDRIAQMAEEHI